MENEIWKDIPNYEGIYQVSDLGRVKSLERKVSFGTGHRIVYEKFLKGVFDKSGYLTINLSKKSKVKNVKIHQLVSICFLNHTPCGSELVVNHKNFIRTDNRVENLEIVTTRENTNQKHIKSSSKYTGVRWREDSKRWISKIYHNRKHIHLGTLVNELDAHKAYQEKLKEINNE